MADNYHNPDAASASQQPDPSSAAEQAAEPEVAHFAPEQTATDAQSQDLSQSVAGDDTVTDFSRLPEIDPAPAMTPKRRERLVLASSAAIFLLVIVCGCAVLFICSSVGQFQPQP